VVNSWRMCSPEQQQHVHQQQQQQQQLCGLRQLSCLLRQ